MIVHRIKLVLSIAFDRTVLIRALKVSLIVGLILNIINQGQLVLQANLDQLNYAKLMLTFFVPYFVSSYSSTLAKLGFRSGEVAPFNALLKCKACSGKIMKVNKGEVIPTCNDCGEHTRWRLIKKIAGNVKEISNEYESMAMFAEHNPAPVIRFNAEGVILKSNLSATNIFERNINGEDIINLVSELEGQDFEKLIEEGRIKDVTALIGMRKYRLELRGIPNLGACQLYGADITRLEEITSEKESMALFAELNPAPVFRFDSRGVVLKSNPAANQAFNAGLTGMNIYDLTQSFKKLNIRDLIANSHILTVFEKIDNRTFRFELRGIPGLSVCQVYGADVSELVDLKEELESMALFAEHNPAPVFRVDRNGVIIKSNPAANDICRIELKGLNVGNVFTQIGKVNFTEIINKGEVLNLIDEAEGSSYRIMMRGIPEFDFCQVYGSDITEIIKTRLENIKFSKAIEQTSNSIMITKTNGEIEFVNKAFEKVTGYSSEEVIGKKPNILRTNHLSKEVYKELWKTISEGNTWKGEFHNRKKDGTTYWEEASISPIKDQDDRIINYMSVKEDVTERKETLQKLESMALFAELNPEPVFRFNRKGVVLQANLAANHAFISESIVNVNVRELLSELNDIDIDALILKEKIITLVQQIDREIYRFILRGIANLEICQIYGSNITERVKASEKIQQQKHDIESSIQYASRIQHAVLPSERRANLLLDKHFILFKPRDIVSGDFYWMAEKNNKIVVTAADCTGHGVPGAFMSMLGVSTLNEIVNKGNFNHANDILTQLRNTVKATLSEEDDVENSAKDGMDMALCIIDKENMTIEYSGAYNPLYIFRKGELEVIKADRMPIGFHYREKEFTNHIISYQKKDRIYMFSDGYTDQFGGEKGNKFSQKKFKELLINIQKTQIQDHEKILESELNKWMGEYKQIDDIVVLGIEF